MNETAKNVLLWVIIAVVLFTVFESFNPRGGRSSDLAYSAFVQNVESGNVSSAKNTIIYAIIGLVVVALAQFIVQFVLQRVTGTS